MLAAQIRLLRAEVEGWPRGHAAPRPEDTYEQRYKHAQWTSHREHLQLCAVAGSHERSSGQALRRARPFLSAGAYRRSRGVKRRADSRRHLDCQWRPVCQWRLVRRLRADAPAFLPLQCWETAAKLETEGGQEHGPVLELQDLPVSKTDVSFEPFRPTFADAAFCGERAAAALVVQRCFRRHSRRRSSARSAAASQEIHAEAPVQQPPPRCAYGASCPWHRIRKCRFRHEASDDVQEAAAVLGETLLQHVTLQHGERERSLERLLRPWLMRTNAHTVVVCDPYIAALRGSSSAVGPIS